MGSKFGYEEVKDFLEKNNLKLLSEEYINNKVKLKLQCSCGEIFERAFQDVKNKNMTKCKYCSGNNLSYKYVYDYILSKGCKLLSNEYHRTSDKLEIECECGNIYKVDFGTFRKGQTRCKKCYWKINKHHNLLDYNYVKNYIENNSDCKLISEAYVGIFEPLEVKCSCGEIWHPKFQQIQKSNDIKCTKCVIESTSNKQRYDWKDVKKEIEKLVRNKYLILGCNYKNCHSDVNLKCLACGHEFKRSLNGIKYTDNKCPFCERSNRLKTIDEVQSIISNYTNEFTVEEYKNSSEIHIRHNTCGHLLVKRLSVIKACGGVRCEKCNPLDSVGVTRVISWLNNNNIEYIREKSFEGCVYKKKLFFDFYLPKYNACIEFDGYQHFNMSDMFGGKVALAKTQKRDAIKDKYCKDNKIRLLRIKYNQANKIETILKEYLQNVNTEVTNLSNVN